MLYLACTTVSSVDLAQYGVSLAKDWVSVECGTMNFVRIKTAYITNTTSIFTVYAEIFAVFQFSRYFAVSMNPRKLKSRNIFLFLSKNRR